LKSVYILRSLTRPATYYTGVTDDVQRRLAEHNSGKCPHTLTARPWELVTVIAFAAPQRAIAFEHYLKSGSGRAFAQRHFR